MIPWYPTAVQAKAHPGRVGSAIVPRGVIVHTTDTLHGSMAAIVHSWTTTPGVGAAAHMIVGWNEASGVTQLVPFDHNSNHAGGTDHGWFKVGDQMLHPNSVTVGIEIEAPGRLKQSGSQWLHPDTGRVVDDVYLDEHGHGWGRITEYQLEQLGALLDWLGPQFSTEPMGTVVHSGGYVENGVPWAAVPDNARVTGHATSNPIQKTDCGPQVMAWLKARGYC